MDQDLGFNVILKRDASKVLKVSWLIILIASICGLGYYVKINYIKLKVDPVVLVKARYVNSRTIPFPGVTICPPNTIGMKYFNLTKFTSEDKDKDPDLEDRKILTASSLICSDHYNILAPIESKLYVDDNTVDVMKKVGPTLDEVFNHCALGSTIECSRIFIRSVTYRGICFTFNVVGHNTLFNPNISSDFDIYKRKKITKSWLKDAELDYHDDDSGEPSNWTIHTGYTSSDDWIQPLRASGLQYLSITTTINKSDISNICQSYYSSFRINIHFPDEIPTFSNLYSQISLERQKYMRLTASIHKIDDNLKEFPPDHRKCYERNERQLRFFKTYTKVNCEHECMSNYTYERCGCTTFFMPRTDDMKVCGFEQAACCNFVYKNWAKSFYEKSVNKESFPDFPCNCYPTCTRIDYTIMAQFSMLFDQTSKNITESGLQIVFGTSQVLETTNYVSYSIQNFVSDIGGLVGLFLGISLLSLFELVVKAFGIVKKLGERLKFKKKTRKRRKKCIQFRTQRLNSFMPNVIPIDQLFGEKIEQSKRFDVDLC